MANKCPTYSAMQKRLPRFQAPQPQRLSASKRGYDTKWQFTRKWFLKAHPLCADCLADNQFVTATEVHHIKPLRDGGTNDESNLMPLCKSCHSRRTKRGL